MGLEIFGRTDLNRGNPALNYETLLARDRHVSDDDVAKRGFVFLYFTRVAN